MEKITIERTGEASFDANKIFNEGIEKRLKKKKKENY